MSEHQVVVVFDVEADSREAAHQAFADVMDWRKADRLPGVQRLVRTAMREAGVESWWFPEPDVKHIDGNDNDAMHLVRDEDWA